MRSMSPTPIATLVPASFFVMVIRLISVILEMDTEQ